MNPRPLIAIIAAVVAVGTLASCSSGSSAENDADAAPTTSGGPETTTAAAPVEVPDPDRQFVSAWATTESRWNAFVAAKDVSAFAAVTRDDIAAGLAAEEAALELSGLYLSAREFPGASSYVGSVVVDMLDTCSWAYSAASLALPTGEDAQINMASAMVGDCSNEIRTAVTLVNQYAS